MPRDDLGVVRESLRQLELRVVALEAALNLLKQEVVKLKEEIKQGAEFWRIR